MSTRKTEVVTGAARLAYAKIWEPQMNDEGKEKYSVCVMIPKSDTATVAAVKAAIEAATEEGLKTKFGGKKAGLKKPLRDGDEKDEDGVRVKGDEFKDMYFLNASGFRQPIILDKNRNEVINKSEVYSGCWANVAINFYAYDAGTSKGIAAGLNAIRKLRDDENLGGGVSVESAKGLFEDIEDEDDI